MNALVALKPHHPSPPELVSIPEDSFRRRADAKESALVVADLFAGAGGFGLGFEFAGAEVKTSVEIDDWACDTLRYNNPDMNVVCADIQKLEDAELAEILGSPDVMIGGPPCQGYSVANIRAGDPKDPRNSLFRHFVRAAAVAKPRAILLENVPGLLKRRTESGQLVISVITDEFARLGYRPYVSVLQAMDFGVPQIRPRLFVLGLPRSTDNPFPAPTHGAARGPNLPTLFASASDLNPHVTVWDAISDLPPLEARGGAEEMPYASAAANDYQRLVRGGSEVLFNHAAMRHSPRMVERFKKVKWGESSADVPSEFGARQRGNPAQVSQKGYDQNNRRMYPDRPCHTIPASFYANFLHPYSHRNFTPREGARLQSFPDWYKFCGKPTVVSQRMLAREGRHEELHLCQYNQIGNAVPPLLAYHLAQHIKGLL
jgi:DNA (cytosine-5)-methyltransferase 1